MALPWVRVWIALVDNDTFKALSPGAKLTFYTALGLAQKCSGNGALYVRGIGPMTPTQIASYTGMRPKLQQSALDELCGDVHFMERDLEGCYHVAKWEEKAGVEAARQSNANRQKRFRSNHPKSRRESWLWTTYRLTMDDFDAMLVAQGHRCNYCQLPLNHANGVVDHIIPLMAKGESEKSNYQLLCQPCNGGKAAKVGEDLRRYEQTRREYGSRNGYPTLELVTELELDTELESVIGPGPRPEPEERQKSELDRAWCQPLLEAVKGLADRRLSSLSPEERSILGRYHAMEFANCRNREANNKAKGVQIAAGLASMGRSKTYGEITVLEYVSYAKRVHAAREKTPWYDPWLIRSAVEFEC